MRERERLGRQCVYITVTDGGGCRSCFDGYPGCPRPLSAGSRTTLFTLSTRACDPRRGVIPLGREGGVAFHSPHSRVVALAMRGLAERPISGLHAQLPSVGEDRRLRLLQRFLPGETGSLGSAPRRQGCLFGHCAAEHLLGDKAFARERPRGDPATYGVGVGAVYSVRLRLGVVVGARAAAVAVAVAVAVAMTVAMAVSMAVACIEHGVVRLEA